MINGGSDSRGRNGMSEHEDILLHSSLKMKSLR